ncbi:hypothetical protein ACOMHN_035344 [Nucella lapillus]
MDLHKIPKICCLTSTLSLQLDIVTLLMTLVAVTSPQQYYSPGKEQGRLKGELLNRRLAQGSRNQAGDKRDLNRFNGDAGHTAGYTGKSNVKDNQLVQNKETLKKQAHNTNHDFGKFSNNIASMAKQIRDQTARNSYNHKDDALYQRNDLNSAESANRADAKKAAFHKGGDQSNNVHYAFTKKFSKASNENGGFDEEHDKNFKQLNLMDEQEQEGKLVRGDSQGSRDSSDREKAARHKKWRSSATQRQAQGGKYGSASRREDQAADSSNDKSVDHRRKDAHLLEQERGKDEAVRLAKNLAQQAAGYQNEATDASDAKRAAADGNFYNSRETGTHPTAAHAAGAVSGNKAREEINGISVNSGFGENASRQEKANEQASGKAASSAEAVNDYQGNKDVLTHDQTRALQDRTQRQSTGGLKDSASHGFFGNNAQAAKSAAESDKNSAAAQSASSLDSKKKNDNEALRSRKYFRKVQNDDSETLSRKKQFFHNKKQVQQGAGNNFSRHNTKNNIQATSATGGFNKGQEKSSQDDSQSQAFNKQERLQDLRNSQQRAAKHSKNHAQKAAADIQSLQPTDGRPLGEITSRNFIDRDLLRADLTEKGFKEHSLPDVIVDIKSVEPPPKVEHPKRMKSVPDMPEVPQVKTYHSPKYSKSKVTYDTGRIIDRGSFNQPTFSGLDSLSIFQRPMKSVFSSGNNGLAKSSLGPQRSVPKMAPTSFFGQSFFGRPNKFNRVVRGAAR